MSRLTLAVPPDYNFWGTVVAHGWSHLPPFVVDHERRRLQIAHDLGTLAVRSQLHAGRDRLVAEVESPRPLTRPERRALLGQLRRVLAVDWDLTPFFALLARRRALTWVLEQKLGRILRGQSLFEDAVKTILTTNCTWSQTVAMTRRLVERLGAPSPGSPSLCAFPSPERMADAPLRFFKEVVRAGYRSEALLACARAFVDGIFRESRLLRLPTPILKSRLLELRGIGPYGAAHLLMLLGRFDELPVDSWMLGQARKKYARGKPVTPAALRRRYASWGSWKALVAWFDLNEEYWTSRGGLIL